MGLCPFHGEKSPSFAVSPSRQTYHCFGCGVHGNAIGFLMEHLGMGFVDAVNDLAQGAGLVVPQDERSDEERERHSKLKGRQVTLSDVLSKASDHYRKQLKSSPRAVDYLKRRGLSGEVAARFAMGYAPEGWRALASAFAHYDDPLLEESGLVISQPSEQDGGDAKRYDRFRDRVMFPIRSVQGDVIGFGGRVLDQGEPKYLNSPETPVFSKGRELYGLFEARSAIRQRNYVLVVEGYMDVVALAQLGFPNAVATLGTACTAEHVQKLFRFTESVVFSFDGDSAGRRAAGRALEAALPYATDTRSVRFLFLPAEHDPDSYVREFGTDGFEQCVQQAVPLSRELISVAQEGCDMTSAEGRARFLALARPLWAALPDGALKRQLLGDLALESRLDANELAQLWQVASGNGEQTPPRRGEPRAPRLARKARQGAANHLDRALWLLMQRPELWWELDSEAHDLLADQAAPYGSLFGSFERTLHEQGALSSESLSNEVTLDAQVDEHAKSVIERICGFHEPEPITDLKHQLELVLDHLRLRDVDNELSLLFESEMASPDIQIRTAALLQSRSRLRTKLAQSTPLQW